MVAVVRLSVLYAAVVCLCIGIVTSNGVSAEVKSVSFDFVMKELIKQRVDIEKQATEMDRQREEIAKHKAELGRQAAEFEKKNREQEVQKSDLDQQRAELERQMLNIQKLQQELQQSRGTSYIRWGRTKCHGDSTVLYKGYAAGAKYTDRGAGANYLCLHDEPQWSRYNAGVQYVVSSIYGVEYEIYHGSNVFSYDNNGGNQLMNHPAPCAMCYVSTRSATVMIPARTECPVGWTKEYQGYIVSEHYGHQRREYICWDEAPETSTGASSQNQGLVHQVEVMCGSLPCSRFPDGLELTCVVCSK